MKLSLNNVSCHTNFIGVALVCSLTFIACTKNNDEKAEEKNTEETKVAIDAGNTTPVVQCDDQVALTHLIQSVKSTVNTRTHNLFNFYVERSGESLSASSTNNAVGSILIDIANPTVLQEANNQGMVTCNASLSVTLPNNDVNRANKVYNTLEGGSLADVLQEQRVTLNNNMLVSDSFNYVVGMQGGQSTARVIGQPAILTAAADIIAKSQFQSAREANRPVPRPRPDPTTPSESRPTAEPIERDSNPVTQAPSSSAPVTPAKPKPAPKPAPRAELEKPKPSAAKNESSSTENKLKTPKDDDIEMVIIEEEGTY